MIQRTEKVKEQFAKMPAEKKRSKFWQVIVGLGLVIFGWNLPHHAPTAPWWFSGAFVVVGIVALGGELVQYPAKRALGLVGDVLDRVRGKTEPTP